MLLDDLRDQLKQLEPDIAAIRTFWTNSGSEAEYTRLKGLTEQEEFWKDPKQVEISQALQRVRTQRESYQEVTQGYQELVELIELFGTDEAELARLAPDIKNLARKVSEFK